VHQPPTDERAVDVLKRKTYLLKFLRRLEDTDGLNAVGSLHSAVFGGKTPEHLPMFELRKLIRSM
jgi:hypothetical protein